MPTPPTERESRLADATLAVLGLAAGFVRDFSEDFHWHLVLGNWTLAHHALMRRDVLSHTFSGQPQHLDYWLSDVVFALGYRALGYPGAYLLRGAALAALLVVLAREGRRLGLSAWVAALGPTLWLGELVFRCYLRPETLTFPLLAALLVLLGLHEARGDRRYLVSIPLLVLLWSNAHSSVGIALAVIGCYCLEKAARAAVGPARDGRRLRELIVLSAASFGAACVNPEGWREPLMFLHVTAEDPTFQAGVDWRPLSLASMTPVFPWLVAVVVVTSLLAWRQISLWRAAAFVLLFGVALWHARFVKTALLVAVPLVAGNLVALARQLEARFAPLWVDRARFALALLGTLTASLLWFREQHVERELGLGLDPGAYPEAACRFAHEHRLPGEMLNAFDFGSFLLFCLPEHRTYIDQRAATLYTPEFSREYRKLPQDPALLARRTAEHHVGFAFVAYDPLARALAARPEWNLVYVDDLAQIFVRSSLAASGPPPLEWLNPTYLASLSTLHGEAQALARAELVRQRAACASCRVTALFTAALGAPADLERVVAERPDDADPNVALLRGIRAFQQGDLAQALGTFNDCLEHGTDAIGAAVWIDRALDKAGQREQRRVLRAAVHDATGEGLAEKLALEELQRPF